MKTDTEGGVINMASIRRMAADDYDAVYQLWRSTPGMGLNAADDSREGIERYLLRNPSTCFVAECSGIIVGAILAGHDGRRGFIYHVAVAAEYRNLGIGTELVRFALAALKEVGIHKAALVAFSKNDAGNLFWERRGFQRREDLFYRNKSLTE